MSSLISLKSNSYLNAGYVFAPYIPLQVSPFFDGYSDFIDLSSDLWDLKKKSYFGRLKINSLVGLEVEKTVSVLLEDKETSLLKRKELLSDPNLDPVLWLKWCWSDPDAALSNAALELFLLEDPNFVSKIHLGARYFLMHSALCPKYIAESIINEIKDSEPDLTGEIDFNILNFAKDFLKDK